MTYLRIKIKAALLLGLALLLHLLINTIPARAEGDTSALSFERCYIDNIDTAAQCFDIKVPLNWSDPAGVQINLHGAIIPAKSMRSEADPLLILAGGPGQAATSYGALVGRAFHKINERRDIILVDQRGTGASHALACDFPEGFEGSVDMSLLEKFGADCAAGFDVDIRYFSSLDILHDLEHVREKLAVDKFNLWGGSYGTRLGLLYMKYYPESVRSAILDGVAPPNDSLFLHAAQSAEGAWQKLVSACEQDTDCARVHPALNTRLNALLRQLSDQPATAEFRDLATGETQQVTVASDWLAEAVRSALYVPTQAAILPFALQRVEQGDYSVLGALAANAATWASSTMTVGSTLAILCREDVPRITPARAQEVGEGRFHEDFYYRNWAALCANWPVLPVPVGYAEPVQADIPTLLLSGALDPVTPPAMAAIAQHGLPNSVHFVADNAGHNVSPFGCAPEVMADFIQAASVADLTADCLNDPVRPAFVLTPAGSTP